MNPITFTEPENRFLQSLLREKYEDDQIRSISGPIYMSMLTKVETWPADVVFTEQEDRCLQVLFEGLVEFLKPYPYPHSPLTFGQDTRQMTVVQSILAKLETAR